MRASLFLAAALLLLLQQQGACAPPPPRPLAGRGVVLVPDLRTASEPLTVYAQPGVHRVARLFPGGLPRLSPRGGALMLAALERSGKWLKVSYDDAERQGWIELPRRWQQLSWDEVLAGRRVRVLPALKKGCYAVRSAPDDAAAQCGSVARDQSLRVVALEGDWARLSAPSGWLRWRDSEGRVTLFLEAGEGPEKR